MPEENDKQKRAEQLLMQFQIQNQQLENLLVQKQTLMFQSDEISNALNELGKGSEFYKIAGPIIVKKGKDELKTELEDRKEEIEIKFKSIEKNEAKLKEMIEKTREKLQEMLPYLQAQQQGRGGRNGLAGSRAEN